MRATIETIHGRVSIEESFRSSVYLRSEYNERHTVQVVSPYQAQTIRYERPSKATVRVPGSMHNISALEAEGYGRAILAASDIAALINEAQERYLTESRADRERRAEERRRAYEERQRVVAERRERLLHELQGGYIKIRERGFKSMVYARVGVRQEGDGEWVPFFDWTTEHIKTQNLEKIVRLDVKAQGRWRTVWDDGVDDLPEYDRELTAHARPTGLVYDGEAI